MGHSKAMWQCEWHNLVANFGTKQCKWHGQILNRFATNQKCILKRNTNMISKEISHIWSLEIQQHLSQDLAVSQSRPCRDVSWFWFLLQEVGRVQAHSWLQVQVHDRSTTLPKWFHSSPGWDSERGGLCFHQGGYALKLRGAPECKWHSI